MGELFWGLSTVDLVVQFTSVAGLILFAAFVVLSLLRLLLRKQAPMETANKIALLALFGGILAVYVAYATLRNQMQFSSEVALSEDSSRIMEWERGNENIRCLYSWFDHKSNGKSSSQELASDVCLAKNIANDSNYTESMLYVEESMFLLQRAEAGSKRWGSKYAQDLEYWKSDVSEDVTGIFSFHLLHRYPLEDKDIDKSKPLYDPATAMEAAGVHIPRAQMCFGAYRVSKCISAAGREAEDPSSQICASYEPSADAQRRVLRLERLCAAEARRSRKG